MTHSIFNVTDLLHSHLKFIISGLFSSPPEQFSIFPHFPHTHFFFFINQCYPINFITNREQLKYTGICFSELHVVYVIILPSICTNLGGLQRCYVRFNTIAFNGHRILKVSWAAVSASTRLAPVVNPPDIDGGSAFPTKTPVTRVSLLHIFTWQPPWGDRDKEWKEEEENKKDKAEGGGRWHPVTEVSAASHENCAKACALELRACGGGLALICMTSSRCSYRVYDGSLFEKWIDIQFKVYVSVQVYYHTGPRTKSALVQPH